MFSYRCLICFSLKSSAELVILSVSDKHSNNELNLSDTLAAIVHTSIST